MKGIEFISDLLTILNKSRQSRDERIGISFLLSRTNVYRGEAILQSHRRNKRVDPSWIQDFGVVTFQAVDQVQHMGFPASGCKIGVVDLPAVVAMEHDIGIHRVAPVINAGEFSYKSLNEFGLLLKASSHHVATWFTNYTRYENNLVIYPFTNEARIFLVLLNPLDGKKYNYGNPQSGTLIYATPFREAEQYKVVSGSIVHNGVSYSVNSVFTAVGPNYTGNGTLEYVNKVRPLTLEDEYPMSSDIAEEVFLKILTKDFQLEKKEIAQLRNDATDELHVMQDQMLQQR